MLPPKLAAQMRSSQQQGQPAPFSVFQGPLWQPGAPVHPPVWRGHNLNFPQQLRPASGSKNAAAPTTPPRGGARNSAMRSRSRSAGRGRVSRGHESSSCSSRSSARSPSCGERRGSRFSRSQSRRSRRRRRERSRSRSRSRSRRRRKATTKATTKAWYGDQPQQPGRPPPVEKGATASADQRALEQWLLGLDGGRGSLMKFIDPLQREFGSLKEVAAAYCAEEEDSTSIVNCVDPVLFEALGVTSLGHKLMFAKGVTKLAGLEDEELADAERAPGVASHHEESPEPETPTSKWVPPSAARPLLSPQPGAGRPTTVRPHPRGSVGQAQTKVSPTSAFERLQEINGGFMSSGDTEEGPPPTGPKPPKCPPPAHIIARAAIRRIEEKQRPSSAK